MDSKGVLEYARTHEAKILDLRFTDLPGLWHHISFPIQQLDEGSFENGFGIDGSSIRGWASIHESDMLLIPDPTTAVMDPFRDTPTLVMIGDVVDPRTRQSYPRDPRFVARQRGLLAMTCRRARHAVPLQVGLEQVLQSTHVAWIPAQETVSQRIFRTPGVSGLPLDSNWCG